MGDAVYNLSARPAAIGESHWKSAVGMGIVVSGKWITSGGEGTTHGLLTHEDSGEWMWSDFSKTFTPSFGNFDIPGTPLRARVNVGQISISMDDGYSPVPLERFHASPISGKVRFYYQDTELGEYALNEIPSTPYGWDGLDYAWPDPTSKNRQGAFLHEPGSVLFDGVVSDQFLGDFPVTITLGSSHVGGYLWTYQPLPGDANRDMVFNSADLVQVFRAGMYEGTTGATWEEGDWNGDSRFTSDDLVLALKANQYSLAATSVPEPTSTLMALMFLPAILSCNTSRMPRQQQGHR